MSSSHTTQSLEQETPIESLPFGPYSPTMFAIAFDLDTTAMKEHYPGDSWNNGYTEIRDLLRTYGFDRQQGSVYYGNEMVTAVTTVLAVQALSRRLSWFKGSVRDIRMLQLLNNDDLSVVL